MGLQESYRNRALLSVKLQAEVDEFVANGGVIKQLSSYEDTEMTILAQVGVLKGSGAKELKEGRKSPVNDVDRSEIKSW